MINVLIKEPDKIYRFGLQNFITEYFKKHFSLNVNFLTEFTAQNVCHADIIFLAFSKGEPFLCIPELKSRRTRGVIGLINDPPGDIAALPFCLREVHFIPRHAPLAVFRQALFNAWAGEQDNPGRDRNRSCSECPHKTLTYRQTKILAHLCNGKSVPEIAHEMMLKPKNVYAHKFLAMQKFELRGAFEMLGLVSAILLKSSQMNVPGNSCEDNNGGNKS